MDIIAKDKNKELVFVEVKTRSSLKYGRPAEAVNLIKQSHIKNVASYFMLKNRLYKQPVRFDIIEILIGKTCWLHHIVGAFQ